jgi:deoxyribodipyrimidine photo-lyase
MRTLVWFRGKDLRVADHLPLAEAAERGEVVPVFVLDPYFFHPERARELPHRMQYLLASLDALAKNLTHLGSRLVVVAGKSVEVVPKLAEAWRCDRVVAHRWVEPFGRERDRRVGAALGDRFVLYEGETLVPPGTVRSGEGRPFAVYSPFARAVRKVLTVGAPVPAPRSLPPVPSDVDARAAGLEEAVVPTMADLGLQANPCLVEGGERAARGRLAAFVERAVVRYGDDRDRLDLPGTSRISADLKFGTLSIRSAWHAAASALPRTADARERESIDRFHAELLWREFAHHTLFDRPELLRHAFRPDYDDFPYVDDERRWKAWAEGTTGYPVVDAAARQLLGEGFVHNRARMIAASFLTKHLRVSFRRGEAHYMKWLVDGDWAQNDAGWQWSAGCGCDAQPYFRVFNPQTQGEKFDPDGVYIRRWVPELARVPVRWIHAPWDAPELELRAAGVKLGETYPRPIVDHATARADFLATAKAHLGRETP